MDDDDRDRQTLSQLTEEMNATVNKRWREMIERKMSRFEKMIKGQVDAQVRGT